MSKGLLLRATQAQRFDEQNREAALAIIERPETYQGAVLNWARAFLARVDAEQEQRSLPLEHTDSRAVRSFGADAGEAGGGKTPASLARRGTR